MGLGTLVAFSGNLTEAAGLPPVTEAQINGIAEAKLAEVFDTDAWRFLVVAEKYQTGFDQPKLCAMYVDRPLKDLQAVQTLSRLNRAYPGKERHGVFVLDFANDANAIQDAFRPHFETTMLEERADPHQVYTLRDRVMAALVIDLADVEAFAEAYFKPDPAREVEQRARIEALVDRGVRRFEELSDDAAREDFRHHLASFRRFYGFIAQIVNLEDAELEKLYQYGRLVQKKLPPRNGGGIVELGDDELDLKRFELEKQFEGSMALQKGEGTALAGVTAVGTGGLEEDEQEALSEIVRRFNERFGKTFTEDDWVNIDAAGAAALNDDQTVAQARGNPFDVFRRAFERRFESYMFDGIRKRSDQAQRDTETLGWLGADPEVRAMVVDLVARRVFRMARDERGR